jgi:hypothetical protein
MHVNIVHYLSYCIISLQVSPNKASKMSYIQAQELVRFDADGRAELQENTLRAVLESDEARNRPVAIISVSGAYRRGKSFLLNFMRRYLEAKVLNVEIVN